MVIGYDDIEGPAGIFIRERDRMVQFAGADGLRTGECQQCPELGRGRQTACAVL